MLGHDFAKIRIHSGPSPTTLPPAPKPVKGEESLGDLQNRQTGAKEGIYASFVTPGLWWLNGATPTLDTLYPTSLIVSLAEYGAGSFNLTIASGADKAAVAGGAATVSGKDLKTVQVVPLAPSTRKGDVKIALTYQAPQAKVAERKTVPLEVRAPHHLKWLGTDHLAQGSWGYTSLTSLQVIDNFGTPMPYIDVNEDFGSATLEPGVSSEWTAGFTARTKGSDISHANSVFQDRYGIAPSAAPRASTMPKPSNPGTPLGRTRVGSFPHDWYVGSPATGKGVHVSHHTGVFYADHAEYTKFTSPPPAAKPAKAPASAGQPGSTPAGSRREP